MSKPDIFGCWVSFDPQDCLSQKTASICRWEDHWYFTQVALVYGQMNEPPGARARVALTGLTVAEYFRDEEGQDVLLFIDNIFRLVLLAFSLFFFWKSARTDSSYQYSSWCRLTVVALNSSQLSRFSHNSAGPIVRWRSYALCAKIFTGVLVLLLRPGHVLFILWHNKITNKL